MKRHKEGQVRIEGKRFGFVPAAFVWRGKRYDVWHVERCWTSARGSGATRLERRYFRLRSSHGLVEIYHDLLANTWGICS